jgi:hypothetical protein
VLAVTRGRATVRVPVTGAINVLHPDAPKRVAPPDPELKRKLTLEGPARFQYELDAERKIRVSPDGSIEDGTTAVVLTNRGLPDEESRRSHREGWGASFDNLDSVLAA